MPKLAVHIARILPANLEMGGSNNQSGRRAIHYLGSKFRPCLVAQPTESYFTRAEVKMLGGAHLGLAGPQWRVSNRNGRGAGGISSDPVVATTATNESGTVDYERLLMADRKELLQIGDIPPAIARHLDGLAALGAVNTYYPNVGDLPLSPLSLEAHEGHCGQTAANIARALGDSVSSFINSRGRQPNPASATPADFSEPPKLLSVLVGLNDAVAVARLCRIGESPIHFPQTVGWAMRYPNLPTPTVEFFSSDDFLNKHLKQWENQTKGVLSRQLRRPTAEILSQKRALLKRLGVDVNGGQYRCAAKYLFGSDKGPSRISASRGDTSAPTIVNSVLSIVAHSLRLHSVAAAATSTASHAHETEMNVVIGIPPPLRIPAVELALEGSLRTVCDALNTEGAYHVVPLDSLDSPATPFGAFLKKPPVPTAGSPEKRRRSSVRLRCVIAGVDPDTWILGRDTIDTVHLSYIGAEKMANAWLQTINENELL